MEQAMAVRAGAARLVTTPPLDVQRGLEGRRLLPPSEGVHDDLHTRALVLESAGRTLAIVSCDAIGIPSGAFTTRVRRLVGEATGIAPEGILLAATHAHSTPWTLHLLDAEIDGHWLETWAHQVASAVALAHRRLAPAQAFFWREDLPLAENRRVPCSDGRVYRNWRRPKPAPPVRQHPMDPELGLLWVEHRDGRPLAVLSNYAMHPVTVMTVPYYSADFPGVATRLVERVYGESFVALFTNGAAGDVNPPNVRDRWQDAEQTGIALGGAILRGCGLAQLRLHRQGEEAPPREGVALAAVARAIHPPFREIPAELLPAAGNDAGGAARRNPALLAARLARLAEEDEPLELQALRIGELALVGVPGELFCAIGLRIKERSPVPHTLIAGYANNWLSYFPTPIAFEEGDYEVMVAPWSRYTAAAGEQIEQTALELLRACWSEPTSPGA